jgi:hypothetical protein
MLPVGLGGASGRRLFHGDDWQTLFGRRTGMAAEAGIAAPPWAALLFRPATC